MKVTPLFLLLLFSAFFSGVHAQHQVGYQLPADCNKSDYIEGQAILKFKPEYLSVVKSTVFSDFLRSIHIDSIQQKFSKSPRPDAKAMSLNTKLVDLGLMYEIYYNPEISVESIINDMMSTGWFEYAVPHFVPREMFTPNDPNIASQYSLTNIRAYQAWNICQGDSNKVVAITDTGIDFSHPDLVNAVKYNYDDPIDGIDNDNDGFIDNFSGWDMGSWDNNPQFSAQGHGIHVSGIAGASTNNSFGMAGTGFKCKILPVKVDNQYGNLVATYESVVYAADHGADVINCSWGSSFSPGQYGQDIVDYATFNCGSLIVAAAGNSNSINPFYPASYNYVLSVAATDIVDRKWVNSSYGYMVDVCAPGKDVYSTWGGAGFVTSSGTSMAAPCVAGAAALVSSYYPSLNMLQVAERLRTTADVVDTLSGNTNYAGWLGTGRINMYRALSDSFSISVRLDDYSFSDSADYTYFPGDTIYLGISALNYLDTSSASLIAQLECFSPYVQLIDSVWNIGVLNPLEDSNNSASDPFVFKLLNVPPSTKLEFMIHFYDGTYHSSDYLSTSVNKDYKTLDTNFIAITVTSNGNMAYNDIPSYIQGEGFRFGNSASLVSGMGLMIGTSSLKVSDNMYSIVVPTDTDFVAESFVQELLPAPIGDMCLYSRFNDSGADSAFQNHINVQQWSYAWHSSEDDNAVYLKYLIRNDSTEDLVALYAGLFADYDIINSAENRIWYDDYIEALIATNTDTTILIATKLLSVDNPFYYAIDNDGFNGSICITDGFTGNEKYGMMKVNRQLAGTDLDGNDISALVSAGPFSIAPNDSIVLTYVIVAGNNVQEIYDGLQRAIVRYYDPNLSLSNSNDASFLLYPNPSSSILNYEIGSMNEPFNVQVLEMNGRVIINETRANGNGSLDISSLPEGMYLIRFANNNFVSSATFTVIR